VSWTKGYGWTSLAVTGASQKKLLDNHRRVRADCLQRFSRVKFVALKIDLFVAGLLVGSVIFSEVA